MQNISKIEYPANANDGHSYSEMHGTLWWSKTENHPTHNMEGNQPKDLRIFPKRWSLIPTNLFLATDTDTALFKTRKIRSINWMEDIK